MPPEAAVVLGLHARDGSTQEIATTIPLEVLSGDDRMDEGGSRLDRWLTETAALSVRPQSVFGSLSAGSDVGR
jgi:hypothetical protein